MKEILLLAFILPLLPSIADCQISNQQTSGQTQTVSQQLYNESQYDQMGQGLDPEFSNALYTIRYQNRNDSTYTMKAVYRDNNHTQLVSKRFYKLGVLEGPFFQYSKGVLSVKGEYKNGRLNGQRLTYRNTVLTQQAQFDNGEKKGIWKEFDQQGNLKREINQTSLLQTTSVQNN